LFADGRTEPLKLVRVKQANLKIKYFLFFWGCPHWPTETYGHTMILFISWNATCKVLSINHLKAGM